MRNDIQGLRAVAVGSVLIFHIWPAFLTGGYVGVDVFFVISGYLITQSLMRDQSSTPSEFLLYFYGRRVRRLIPASLTVLVLILLALPLLPAAQHDDVRRGVAASALYFENWRLAFEAVDYLGGENLPAPTQHFWSLSVEEQFYFLWPGLLLFSFFVASKRNVTKNRALAALALFVIVTSLFASWWVTKNTPQVAYFVSHTRFWELAFGGLLATISRVPARLVQWTAIIRLLGLVMIAAACVFFTKSTPFPGFAALLPVVGSGMVLFAGLPGDDDHIVSPVLTNRLSVFVGDISYSLYLIHWPVIIFWQRMSGQELSLQTGMIVLISCMVYAYVSKRFIEDPSRHLKMPNKDRAVNIISIGAICGLIPAAFAFATLSGGGQVAATADFANSQYPGPAVFRSPRNEIDTSVALIPPVALLKKDIPDAYSVGCHVNIPSQKLNPCKYGSSKSGFRVALLGDSHSAQWIPAVRKIADEFNWYLETHTKSGCPVMRAAVKLKDKPYVSCSNWGKAVLKHIAQEPFDLILYSQSARQRLVGDGGQAEMVKSVRQTLVELRRSGAQIIVIADTPQMAFDPASCADLRSNCKTARKEARIPDPMALATRRGEKFPYVDLTNSICNRHYCEAVVGNVVVWRDKHHLTATYAGLLSNQLLANIVKILNQLALKAPQK